MAERAPKPLLDRLEARGVFSVAEQDGGTVMFWAGSDATSYDELTAGEITELAGELLALAASIT